MSVQIVAIAQAVVIVAIVIAGIRAWQQRERDIAIERDRLLERIQRPERPLPMPSPRPARRSPEDEPPPSRAHLAGLVASVPRDQAVPVDED